MICAGMIQLVYVSSATWAMSETALLALLEQARARNARQHVTGMLLYAGDNFIQVLEGEAADVEEIYAAIVNDDRHKDHIVLRKGAISSRTFADWSMGFRQVGENDLSRIPGFTNFLDAELPPKQVAKRFDDVLLLLYGFRQNG